MPFTYLIDRSPKKLLKKIPHVNYFSKMKISVIGAGNWGTALASLLAGKGLDVTLWAYEPIVAEGINKKHQNPLYLAGIALPANLVSTSDIASAVRGKDMVVFVVPSHVTRQTAQKIAPHLKKGVIFVSCTKGIETESGKLISDILTESMPDFPKKNFCFLSGPSFASEVAKKLPTTVVVAGKNPSFANQVQETFHTDYFMPFTSDDIVGVQVGGAVKNVVAIACGISDGLGFGSNTRAATITRGLYEMIKIGKALGADPLTFAGLAGIGDLVLTCTSELSRNRQIGFQIGQGIPLTSIQKGRNEVAEGVVTSKAIFQLSKKLNIFTPICTEVYEMLYNSKPPKEAVRDLTRMEIHKEISI